MASSVFAPWYYRGLGRLEAEKMLSDSKRDGTFLVRESESMKGAHVLSIRFQDKVYHYRVMPSERGYYMQTVTGVKQKYFRTITELVQFYKQPTTLLVSRLIYPITARTQDDDNGSDPRRGTVPGSCQAPAGPVLYAGSPADSMRTSEYKDMMKRMREEVYHLTAIVEEKQSEVNQMKVEMDQMSVDLDEMTVQKREMEQRLDETVQLLRNAEVALEREEVRLRDNAYHLTAISEEKQREMDQMKEQTRVEMGELELLIDETLQLLKNAKAPGEMAEGRLRDCDHHLTAIIEEKEKEMDHMEIEMDQMRAEKGKLERRIDGTVQLLRDAEAAFEEGEERLRNNCHHLTAINETEQLLGNAQAASNVAEERLRDGGRHLTAIIEETQREMDQMKLEMELMRVEKGDLEQRLDETAQVLRNAEAAFDEAQERLKGNAHHLTAIVEEKQREMDQMKLELDQARVEKEELEERMDETVLLLQNAEAAFVEAEERLRDNEQVLKIQAQDVQLSDKELGSGSFGGVRVGYWRGCPVAVKILHEELAKENYQRRLFEQEMSVCSRLHHPNIAAICGVIQQRDAPLSLIMELLQASLADVIEAAHVSGTYLTLREQTDISHDCISGLAYLHNLVGAKRNPPVCPSICLSVRPPVLLSVRPSVRPSVFLAAYLPVPLQGNIYPLSLDLLHTCCCRSVTFFHYCMQARPVLHGDIRPTNVLVTSVMRAKLGDLGAARFTDASLSVGPMSPLYVAPERLADRTLPNTREADLYSMGVSLGELFTGDQLDRKDRILQLRSVRQRGLRLVCVKMACEDSGERMMASAALTVNDRVVKTEEYRRCGPRRMVKGLVDGVDKVTLCEKPW